MKLKRFLSLILSVSMLMGFVPNAFAEETTESGTTEEVVSDTFEVKIEPENYAMIILQKGAAGTADAGYHKSIRAKQLYYNTIYTPYVNIYSEHASLISDYDVPLKDAINSMAVTYALYSVKNLYNGSVPVFYDFNRFPLDDIAGIYAGPSTTTTTDENGESIVTEVPASEQYAKVKSFTDNYWVSTGTTNHKYTSVPFASKVAASMTTTTAPAAGETAFTIKDAVLTAFKADKTTDYITLATGRETSGFIELQYSMDTAKEIPYITATYSKAAILEAINSSAVENIPGLLEDLDAVGLMANTTAGYEGYSALIAPAKAYVDKELLKVIEADGFADLDAFYLAYDKAVSEVSSMTQEEPVTATISPENYASIHIYDEGYHGYSRAERVFYNTPYADNAKFYAESGSVITSYKIPLKNLLKEMAVNYSINTAGQMSNGHVPVFYDLNKFEIDAPAGAYDMVVEDTTIEDTTTEVVTTDDTTTEDTTTGDTTTGDTTTGDTTTGDGGNYDDEDEEGSGDIVDIPTGDDPTDVVTTDVYKNVLDYTSNYWPASEEVYSYGSTTFASKVAHKITSSSTGRLSHDVTGTALKAFLADENAEYITLATGRETSGYINFSLNLSSDDAIPTLSVSYDAAELVNMINSAESADAFAEILKTFSDAGILTNSVYGYAGYTGVGEKYKKQINEALYEQVSDGGYLRFADFIAKYDESVLFVANNIINNPDVLINFNDKTGKDSSGNSKDATIVGDVSFVTGPDGTDALRVDNAFGKTATEYLNMGEYDFSTDSFSIVFWLRAPERGIEYESNEEKIPAGTPVDFSTYTGVKGGVVFSNKDFSVNDNTGFAFAAMPVLTDFAYNMKLGDNAAVNTVGVQTAVDSRWHQISYVVNRQGKATFYVDNNVIKETDISKLTGSMGVGNIIFGADGLGQYGMTKGEFDDIKIYSSALEASKIEELYYKTALDKLNNDILTLLSGDNAILYSEENIIELEGKLEESVAFVGNYQVGNTGAMIEHYNQLDEYFNNWLNKDVKSVVAFGSDVHISEPSETHLSAQNLNRFLTESLEWENPAKSFVLSGDLADVGADDLRYFFSHLDKWVAEGSNMVITRGNHDEPVGSEKDTGVSYTRAELKNKYVAWMDKYVNKNLSLNESVINSEGALAQPFYYSTDGYAHYIAVDNFWPTYGVISDTQLIWLENVLNRISGDGKPIFFVMHLVFYGTIPRVETDKNQMSKESDTKLKNLLKNYDNVFVLNGHHHESFETGSGTPINVKLDDGTESGVWQINTTVLCSKTISRSYEWAGGYYINIYDDRLVFRARDFENQKWLRDYDFTLPLTEATKETNIGEIKLINPEDNSEYDSLTKALGNTVKVQVPVTLVEEAEVFETALAMYSETGLLGAKTGNLSIDEEYIEFETLIPAGTTTLKVMCFDSIEGMKPIDEAAVLTAASKDYTSLTFNVRTVTTADKEERAWDNRKAAVVEHVNNSGASVIFMQEVENGEQHEYIAENISEKYDTVYYPATSAEDSGGMMVAYDKSVFENAGDSRFWLSETPEVESFGWDAEYIRMSINVKLKDKENGGILDVYAVHLDNSGEVARIKGLEVILDKVKESEYPVIMSGDFNAKSGTDVYETASTILQDCQKMAYKTDCGVTYNGWGKYSDYESTAIDFCFVSKDTVKPLTHKICRDRWDGNYYSDHYAVKTRLRVMF